MIALSSILSQAALEGRKRIILVKVVKEMGS
jgi:hypothetical protein